MSRVIKYRAWDKRYNKFVDLRGLRFVAGGEVIGIEVHDSRGQCCFSGAAAYELMQFTGLLDARGREIYEGDIVKRTMHYGNDRGERCGKGEERITAVKWSKQYGMQMVGFSFFPCDDINKLEVIGNIYENPELLKAGDK